MSFPNELTSNRANQTYKSLHTRHQLLFYGYQRNSVYHQIPLILTAIIACFTVDLKWIQLLLLSINELNKCSESQLSSCISIKIRKYIDSFVIFFASRQITISLKRNYYKFNESIHSLLNNNNEPWHYVPHQEWMKIYIKFSISKQCNSSIMTPIQFKLKVIIFNKFRNTKNDGNNCSINLSFTENLTAKAFEIITIQNLCIHDQDIQILNSVVYD